MQKVKLTFLIEVEYEQDPEYYPEGSSAEEMLAIDLMAVNDDPYLTMNLENAKWDITGKILDNCAED